MNIQNNWLIKRVDNKLLANVLIVNRLRYLAGSSQLLVFVDLLPHIFSLVANKKFGGWFN